MSTSTEYQQPSNSSSFRRLIARHPVAAFLVMLYTMTWIIFLPLVLSERGLLALPIDLSEGFAFQVLLSVASILGVALPAFLVTAATGGRAAVRDLLRRCLRWRVGIGWYLMALFGLMVANVLVGSIFLRPTPLQTLVEKWQLLFTLFLPEVLLPFIFIQLFEEAGWTGFMQHTLQERRGPMLASILVAPAFVLQHLPILIDGGIGLATLIIIIAGIIVAIFFRTVIMWLYNGSGRSVLVVALFHSAYNSAWSMGDQKFTGELISGSALFLIPIGVLVVFAVAIAVLTKGRLAFKPERERRSIPTSSAAHPQGSSI